MKKYHVYFGVAAVAITIFSSCHKGQTPTAAQTTKQYNVSFNVGFSQTVTNFNAVKSLSAIKTDAAVVTDTLNKYLSVLHYHVYDSNMHEVRNGVQNSTDTGFGDINLQLANGTYTVIVDAGDTGFIETDTAIAVPNYNTTTNVPIMAYQYNSPATYPVNSNSAPFKANTFYKKTSITINNSPASYSIALDRLVGQIKIDIQDILPANAKSLTVMVSNDVQSLSLTGLVPYYASTYYYNITPVTSGTQPAPIYITVANTASPFTVEIKSTNGVVSNLSQIASYKIIGDKLITGVTCTSNATTVLTGDLFNGLDQGFTITYNPAWDPGTPTTINF